MCAQHSKVDPEKIETEMQFYGFTLDDFKKDLEKSLRTQANRRLCVLTENIVRVAEKDLSPKIASQLKIIADNSRQIIKPDLVRCFIKMHVLIDKHLAIPDNMPLIDKDVMMIEPSAELDDVERAAKEKIAEMEKAYQQQKHLMDRLRDENNFYDTVLVEETEIDNGLCDIFENSLAGLNFSTDVAEQILKKIQRNGVKKKHYDENE